MKRVQLVALVSLSLVVGQLSVAVGSAYAEPKKKAAEQAQQDAPRSAAIAKAMGDLKWGTPREQVLERFMGAIREKYRPLIAKATGAIEEDKFRAQMREELARLKESIVEFNGTKTGVDVSFLKGEFTHGNQESVFLVKDGNSQNYYFFIQGKLWKWFKAFNASTFEGKTFDQVADAIQGRYGKGRARDGELTAGSGKQRWIEWQDGDTRLRAIDNTQFYGFYCLVFDDKGTVHRLPQLRAAAPRDEGKKNTLVDAVTSGPDAEDGDGNVDVVDRITGKIRRRQDAPAPAGPAGGVTPKKKTGAASPPAGKTAEPRPADNAADPLRGI